MWVAIWTVFGAIGLSFALPFLGGLIDSDAAEADFYVGVLVATPAFLLLVPVLILAVVVDCAGRRIYAGKPIVASWDVRLDGEDHVVSLPASRVSSPEHAWVDGARVPLAWTPTGAATGHAALDGGTIKGLLSVGYDGGELAVDLAASAVLGVGTGGPGARYTLQVEDATVEAIPVADGERRS